MQSGGREGLAFWYSVLEARAGQAREIARLCALRGSRELKAELVEIAAAMQAEVTEQGLYALELKFWDRAIEGAGNIVYRLSYNSMTRAAEAMGDEARGWSVREIRAAKYRVPLAAAIAAGDEQAAEARARASMQVGLDGMAALLHGGSPERQPGAAEPSQRARTKPKPAAKSSRRAR